MLPLDLDNNTGSHFAAVMGANKEQEILAQPTKVQNFLHGAHGRRQEFLPRLHEGTVRTADPDLAWFCSIWSGQEDLFPAVIGVDFGHEILAQPKGKNTSWQVLHQDGSGAGDFRTT